MVNIYKFYYVKTEWIYEKVLKKIYLLTAQKIKFSIKDFFRKWDQIRRKLRIWSHLLKESLMENFIFCAVLVSLTSLSIFTFTYSLIPLQKSTALQHFSKIFRIFQFAIFYVQMQN